MRPFFTASFPLSLSLIVFLLLCFSNPAVAAKPKSKLKPRLPAAKSYKPPTQSDELSLERILKSENQRLIKDPYLLSALHHPSSRVVRAAILALGRIGDRYAIEPLARFFNRKDPELKMLAAFSLSLIGDDLSTTLLSQYAAMEKNPEVRGAILLALGRSGSESAMGQLARMLQTETSETVLSQTSEGLGLLWSGESANWAVSVETLVKLVGLSKSKTELAISAAFALSRFKGDVKLLPLEEIIDAIGKSPFPYAQGLLCRTLAKAQAPSLGTTLATFLVGGSHPALRIEAAKALKGRSISSPILAALKQALTDKVPQVVVAALETIGSYGTQAKELSEHVDRVYKNFSSTWVKATALKVLCRIDPETGKKRVADVLHVPTSPTFPAAVTSLVFLGGDTEMEQLITFLNNGDPPIIGESIDALASLPSDKWNDPLKSALKNILGRADMGLSSQIAELAGQNKWKEFAPLLATAYASFTAPDQVEVKVALLNALALVGSESQVPMIQLAIKDNDRSVVVAAVNALKAITGKDESAKIPLNSKISDSLPPWSSLKSAVSTHVLLKTTQGEIEIKMSPETPVTAYQFVRLVQTHFYDGKNFHRVVPNFVTQGGDPRGDGFGGPGFLIRDEVTPRRHDRGNLGIATAGKDTGGCQFFFNLAPNLHLSGRYTNFAEVVKGMDVVDRLEIGDRILSAKVK